MSTLAYLRVSTADKGQTTDSQRYAIEQAVPVDRFFEDVGVSGGVDPSKRPGFTELLAYARPDDTLVVYRLDRLARSLRSLLTTLDVLAEREIAFRSVSEAFDTSSPAGRMTMQLLGALGEYEKALIQSRVRAGLDAAKAQGRTGGRPKALSEDQVIAARARRARGESLSQIATALVVGKSTVHRALTQAAK